MHITIVQVHSSLPSIQVQNEAALQSFQSFHSSPSVPPPCDSSQCHHQSPEVLRGFPDSGGQEHDHSLQHISHTSHRIIRGHQAKDGPRLYQVGLIVLQGLVSFNVVLYVVLYCIVLYCIVMYCSVLYCIVL